MLDDRTKRQIALDLQQACLLSEFIGQLEHRNDPDAMLELSELTEERNLAVRRIRNAIDV